MHDLLHVAFIFGRTSLCFTYTFVILTFSCFDIEVSFSLWFTFSQEAVVLELFLLDLRPGIKDTWMFLDPYDSHLDARRDPDGLIMVCLHKDGFQYLRNGICRIFGVIEGIFRCELNVLELE